MGVIRVLEDKPAGSEKEFGTERVAMKKNTGLTRSRGGLRSGLDSLDTSQQGRGNRIQILIRFCLVAIALAGLLALTLMTGCTAEASDTNAAVNTDTQAQQTNSIDPDQVSGDGFVLEDTAVVNVNIDEEGQ